MTGLFDGQAIALAFHIALGFGAGVLLGLVHFSTLRWNTRLYLGSGIAPGLGLQLLRFAVLAVVFFALVRIGAGALLSGALGLFVARRLLLSRAGGLP